MNVASPAEDRAICPSCGEANPAHFRLCGFCRAHLAADRPVDEIRRSVTVVNSDLKGSTALGERLDPESLREVLTRYFDEMRMVFEAHGGTIEKIIGDAIVAVFGMPIRHDDDALRAVRAALESMQVLASLNDQLEQVWGVRLVTRTGVSTGEVVVGDLSASQHVLTGETMNVSSSMEQNAPPLEVLIAAPTYDLVRDFVQVEPMGPVTPKGMEKATEAYRLISVTEPASHAAADAATGAAAGAREDLHHCSNCGEENSVRQQFCGMCGSPLVVTARAKESRKTVTLVFADPKPRTESGEPPSPTALREVMSRYFEEMRRALERHGGTVEKFIGDAVMAVYGLPVRHEDDAVRALRAALDMQAALPALNEDFVAKWGIRLLNAIGVNTGEVIAGDATLGQRLVTGDAVNVAARLEQAAGPAEVIIGDLTYRLAKGFAEVETIPPLTLKGKAEPVPAYRLVSVRDRPLDAGAGASTFVGREEEMGRLAAALAAVASERVTRLLTIVGDAGVGKSRLVKEFAARAGEGARVLRGRCLPYGDGITFWPLAEVVREAAGIAADDPREVAVGKLAAMLGREDSDPSVRPAVVERVAAAIGLSSAQFPVAELFWGARHLLETMGRRRPLIIIVDDIHSAEKTFLELLDHLTGAARDASIMLLCSARHELLERHAEWTEAQGEALIVLRPLSETESGRIVGELLGQAQLDRSVIARITEAAVGNPLFVEQMVSMLIDSGLLRQEGGRWVAAAASRIAVPPTIHALLAARFDSLGVDEKQVLEPASVIGLMFPVPAVAELVEDGLRPSLQAHLAALDRKQFVKPATLDEDAAFAFAHILVRDTAYGSLLKRARASYHERFVDWAERVNAERGRGQEFEEIHGYHLEQAYRYRTELGVVDEGARTVGRRASVKLASAGRRALGRGDIPAAANLLRRATETRGRDDPERLALVPDLGLALMELGEFADAAARLEEAGRLASEAGDRVVAARARLVACYVQLYSGEAEDWSASTSREVDRALPIFEAAGDEVGQTLAWRLRSGIYGMAQRFGDYAKAAEQVIVHARRAGDVRAETRAAITYATAAVYGPTPVAEAIAECERLVASSSGDQIALVTIKLQLAQLYAMRGEFDRARELYRGSRERLEDVRAGIAAARTSIDSSLVEMLAGDPAAAERELRLDRQALTALGESFYRFTVEGLLARAVLAQGRVEEAAGIIAGVRDGAAADDLDAQALWRSVFARVLAASGDPAGGLAFASEAVALRRDSDSPMFLADALEDAGRVMRAARHERDAQTALTEALELVRAKGDLVSEVRLQALLGSPPAE
jgi:class 3 adenylate cyclase/tetratricopeptide (TPR) repeat protein